MYNGIINVRKEKGFTSHDVVAKMRGILGQKKIGHTGTLDPDAEGVLPVCLGTGTKLSDMLADTGKEYVATVLLGVLTDTQDLSGRILQQKEVQVTGEDVKRAAESFLGKTMQLPPMYSAIKVNGKKLYELARKGQEVERRERPIEISEIEILDMQLPEFTMRVACSKGTYIRTLCNDIGERLGCFGAMKALLRTKVSSFHLEQAHTLAEIEQMRDAGRLNELIVPVDTMFADLPGCIVKKPFQRLIENGNAFYVNQAEILLPDGKAADASALFAGCRLRVYDEETKFYGVYRLLPDNTKCEPVKMFLER
ncbi:MAG: tRNA pseudouridine(55) synthase TruB [Lachnospiraceae bacterium]|nr:tRNA pseudouridine(55) synthase TruB [Lachnospiraceae bacterium]